MSDKPLEISEEMLKPWSTKKILISLGGIKEEDDKGYMLFTVMDTPYGPRFSIFEGSSEGSLREEEDEGDHYRFVAEDLDINAARLLRDFLNYAVPD